MQNQQSDKTEKQLQKMKEQQCDADMPQQDDIPDLWKKSSLRERTDPQLPQIIQQKYKIQRSKTKQGQNQISQYIMKQQLGRGAFGQVYRAININDETQQYAIKVYSLWKLQKNRFFAPDGDFANSLDMLDNELNIIKRLQHANLPKFNQILHSQQYIYLVHEYCSMGQIMKWDSLKQNYYRDKNIYKYIQDKYKVTQLYDVTKVIFAQVCSVVKYLHDQDITNRDIKVDNILCTKTQSQLKQIKLTDFTTIRYSKDDISYFPSGTPGFRGPQHQFATEQGYSSKSCDVWSTGISMYTYFYENLPFYGESQLQIDIKAKNNPLEFDESCPQWLKNLINKMTQKQWKNRISINQALKILTEH